MARYVDVEKHCEKLMNRIEDLQVRAQAAESQRNHPLAEELNDEADNLLTAVILLRQIPEEDVAPIQRGKWVLHTDGKYFCDNCRVATHTKQTSCCPDCGAIMRLIKSGEDNGENV